MASNKPTGNAPTGKAPIIKKMFLHNRKTNQRYRINGAKETDRKPKKACLNRDFSQYVAYATPQLPQKVDLRPWMTQIEDQSGANSCTANAMAGLYEYLNYRTTGRLEDVSRLFIYYNARVRDNDDSPHVIDDGSTIPSTIETIEEFGVCPEYIWPYNMKKVNTKPTKQAYSVAPQYSISEALKLDINVNEMKSCLAQGFPILTIIELYKSFDKAEAHGVVPMPKSNETSRSSHGSHALLLSGYSDHSRAFIVRNSWGASWGDRGYCYIPYDYICNDKLCDSAWTVKKLGVATMGNEGWEDEDEVDYLDDDDEEDDDEDDDDADIEEVDEEDEPEDDDYEDDDDDDDEEEE